MLNDLRYAMGQIDRARGLLAGSEFWAAIIPAKDAMDRAKDALERCIEAAPAMEAAFDRQQIEAETYK